MRSLRRHRDADRTESAGHAERGPGPGPGRDGRPSDGRPTAPGGVQPIGEAPDRLPVRLEGTLRTLTLRPRGGVPALEAELADGTGTLTVVWLGRRHISGVHAGRGLRVQGRIGVHEGQRTMYNPRYELLP